MSQFRFLAVLCLIYSARSIQQKLDMIFVPKIVKCPSIETASMGSNLPEKFVLNVRCWCV